MLAAHIPNTFKTIDLREGSVKTSTIDFHELWNRCLMAGILVLMTSKCYSLDLFHWLHELGLGPCHANFPFS